MPTHALRDQSSDPPRRRLSRRTLFRRGATAALGLTAATLVRHHAPSLGGLVTPAPAAAASAGKLLFFYNQATGAGALGYFSGSQGYQGFVTVKNWGPESWATGWTLIAASPFLLQADIGNPTLDLTFYSASSLQTTELLLNSQRTIVRAQLNLATLSPSIQPSGGRYLGLAPWFKPAYGALYQYYDPSTQSALLRDGPDTVRDSVPVSPCTHLVCVPRPNALGRATMLYYNAYTGAGATLQLDSYTDVSTWQMSGMPYPAGAFATGWTHIVANDPGTGIADILFYNWSTGAFAVARLTSNPYTGDGLGLTTVLGGGPGAMGTWTHIVAAGSEGFCFYNQQSGAVATGVVDSSTSIWQFVPTRVIPNGFSTGWTHIV